MTPDERTLRTFIDLWEFFGTATMAGVVAGVTLGALGVYVVARGMVFFSATLSQSAGLGVVLSLFAWHRLVGATSAQIDGGSHHFAKDAFVGVSGFVFAAVSALLLSGQHGNQSDRRLGFVYLMATALILTIGAYVPQSDIPNVTLWMFSGHGDAGLMMGPDFARLLWICVPIIVLHIWWIRGFVEVTIDPIGAKARGLPVGVIRTTLLLTLALATAVCTQLLGMLPVFAYTTLPAIGALRLAPNVPWAIGLAAFMGGASGFLGYFFAYKYALTVGATQTLVAGALAILAVALGQARRRGRSTKLASPL